MTFDPRTRITAGVILAFFLSGLEITVVGTAAPKIVSDLGGLDAYSWLFTIYLLTSTVVMPLWGRASDIVGRKKTILAAIAVFILGSILCGCAQSMPMLILARGIKGIGGGGLVPLGFTIIADLYDKKERAEIQGYLSSAWGISSIIGPFIGGSLADLWGWRSIFFINMIPGAIALFLINTHLQDRNNSGTAQSINSRSLITSVIAMTSALLSLKFMTKANWITAIILLISSIVTGISFFKNERKAKYPLIPHGLFKVKTFVISCATGLFFSLLVVGLASFTPLLYQINYHYTATESGLLLVPFSVSWVMGAIMSTRLMLKINNRTLFLIGTLLTFLGYSIFMFYFYNLSTLVICLIMIAMGIGMAFNYPIALISVQHDAPTQQIGFATAALTWVRNLGATLGSAIMGTCLLLVLRWKINHTVFDSELTLKTILNKNPDIIFSPELLPLLRASPQLTLIFHDTLFWVFCIMFLGVGIGTLISFFFPNSKQLSEQKR